MLSITRSTPLAGAVLLVLWPFQVASSAENPSIRVVSSAADAVSGGSALVQLEASGVPNVTVLAGNTDVTVEFRRSARTGKLLSRISGLRTGTNVLNIDVDGVRWANVTIRNHPLNGPIFSGPHQQPFYCQTEANGLGRALDADCTAATRVQYYYKSTDRTERSAEAAKLGPGFQLYDVTRPRPADVAQLVLPDGKSVSYIVRSELGVINRAVYRILYLHEPGQALPDPWTSFSSGWNGRLIYMFHGGCQAGYGQGVLPTDLTDQQVQMLSLGYAVATSTLNVLGNDCNEQLSSETAAMVKEYFIKQYGEPEHTIGFGISSGGVSAYLTAQNHPGILDGVIVHLGAPDHSTMLPLLTDCALLSSALKTSALPWTEAQMTAVSGFATWRTCSIITAILSQANWLDPKNCPDRVPKEMIYDRRSNPYGVRCTFYDNSINTFGRDPKTGFARRTLDNTGIQYGLVAFQEGKIRAEQFLELNEKIGGYDLDGRITPARTSTDEESIRIARDHGAVLTGRNLDSIPIVDWNYYADDLGDLHTRDRVFFTRQRLTASAGDARNQSIVVTPPSRPIYASLQKRIPGAGEQLRTLLSAMDRWLTNISVDATLIPRQQKVIRNKPAELADKCIGVDGEIIFEPATYKGRGRCNDMYPSHGNPRIAAGAPPAGDVLKCALKPVNPAEYPVELTPTQVERLRVIFPGGVCDYSVLGIGQQTPPMGSDAR